MKENTTKDMDVYSKDSTVIERPESYNIGVKVGWTAPAKWWNWLFKNVTERLKDIFVTTTSIHNEIKNAVGGTLDPESDTQLKDKLEQMKKDLEDMTAQVQANLTALEDTRAKPNGLASLDPDGRIPYSQLPESAMEFKGDWNASTNTPTLVDGTGDLGDMYLVSVGGTVDLGSGSITFLDGDRVIYNQAGKWEKISGGSVKSVNNAAPDDTGNVNVVVDTDHIEDSAVTADKIASGAVTEAKIANGAVTKAKIASNSVYTQHISDNAVTAAKIANNAIKTINTQSIVGLGNITIADSPFYIVSNGTELQNFIVSSTPLKQTKNLYLKSGEYKRDNTGGFSFSNISGLVIAEPGAVFKADISGYNGPGMYNITMDIAATVNSKSIVRSGFITCNNLYNCTCKIKITSTYTATPTSMGAVTVAGFKQCNNLISCTGTAEATGGYLITAKAYGFSLCNRLLHCTGNSSAKSNSTPESYSMYKCTSVAFCIGNTPAASTFASNAENNSYLIADTPAGGFNKV